MKKLIKNKFVIVFLLLVVILSGVFGVNQVIYVDKAHQTFENYYAFRGCTQLLKRTNDFGLCKLPSGKTIKLVEFHGKWYLYPSSLSLQKHDLV